MKNMVNFDGPFSMPCELDFNSIVGSDEKVVVVSVVGHSEPEDNCDKTAVLGLLLGYNISQCSPLKPIQVDDTLVRIEGWYDSSRHLILLHLIAAKDCALLCGDIPAIDDLYEEHGHINANNLLDVQYHRALLLLLSVSHIVLFNHTTDVFDHSVVTTLKKLNNMRTAVLSHLIQWVGAVTGGHWSTAGRLCTPRILFLFSAKHVNIDEIVRLQSESRECTSQVALRLLETTMEDTIYRLFRRTWVITNNCAHSIVALPNQQSFVYFIDQSSKTAVDSATLQDSRASQLLDLGLLQEDGSTLLGLSKKVKPKPALDTVANNLLADQITDTVKNTEHRFSSFLQHHIKMASTEGFDDNVGKGHATPMFVLPTVNIWMKVTNKLYHKLLRPELNKVSSEALSALTVDSVLVQAVRKVCCNAVVEAIELYNKNMPDFYPISLHQHKLAECLSYFDGASYGGSLMLEYRTKLDRQVQAMWESERKGCEQLSLTGHACAKQSKPATNYCCEGDSYDHSFAELFQVFCNCGHSSAELRDSCNLRYINSTFYIALAQECCQSLEAYTFPSVENGASTELINVSHNTGGETGGSDPVSSITDILGNRLTLNTETLSQQCHTGSPASDLHVDENAASDVSPRDTMHFLEPKETGDVGYLSDYMEDEEDSHSEQHASTTVVQRKDEATSRSCREHTSGPALEPMLCSTSPPNFLPLYSAWSLVCVGPSSLYSHKIGIIDQPGFLPGSNHLLPWDVRIKVTNHREWSFVAESLKKTKSRLNLAPDEFSVKVFVGLEYECRGCTSAEVRTKYGASHRFLLSSPRSVLQTHSGQITPSAAAVVNQAMPLYHTCPCSTESGSPSLGQLMRIHVITPKAPVRVQLDPKVQPGPSPCPSYFPQPPSHSGVKLSPASYWVLRLPHIYTSSPHSPHYPPDPSHPLGVENGCLLPGCFSVSEVDLDR